MASIAPRPSSSPPHLWKSLYSQQLASKKITEEFEYFAKVYQRADKFKAPDAVKYALEHASKRSVAGDLLNKKESATSLPQGSKVCIVGAGMAGKFTSDA